MRFRLSSFGRRRATRGLQRRRRVVLHLEALEARRVPGFLAGQDYDVGIHPSALAWGDFNGDGVPDLAVANGGSATVSVLLGNGDGSFQAARDYAVPANPGALAVGDFTGDGRQDLVVVSPSFGGSVSVLLSNGDGSFQPARTIATEPYPVAVAVGDFTGDGILDLAVALRYSDAVALFRGNGDGTFQPPRFVAAGNNLLAIAAADFNGDGHLDLAVTDASRNEVQILLGNGDGTFQAPRRSAAGNPVAVAVGDFNGDGIQDLAVATSSSNSSGFVSVLLGNGDGSFQPARTISFGALHAPVSVAVGDFNGDGTPDLAASVYSNSGGFVSVLLGNGDGSFQPAHTFATESASTVLAEGDFNGDGNADLAVANQSSNNVSLFLGTGDGGFQTAYTIGGVPTASVVVGDFNGDGIPDLAAGGGSAVSVLLGNGDGSFQPAHTFAAGPYSNSVAVGDFNGDGILDLAVVNGISGTVSVLLGNGDGSFQPAQTFATGPYPMAVAVGDFNGDGIQDLAVTDYGDFYGNGSDVSILLGNGDGTFQPAHTFAAGDHAGNLAVGDFNGDGIPDLAVVGSTYPNGTVSVLLGNGDGSFQPAQTFQTPSGPNFVAVGDFNGDGIPDLAVAGYASGFVSVLLGNGDGSFQPARSVVTGGHWETVAVGDFNGDGILDLAVLNPHLGQPDDVQILLGNGDGSFQSVAPSYRAGSVDGLAVADFNGDGAPDLAAWDFTTVAILLNDGRWPAGAGGAAYRPPAKGHAPHPIHAGTRFPRPEELLRQVALGLVGSGAVPRTLPATAPVKASLPDPSLRAPAASRAEIEPRHPDPTAFPLAGAGRPRLTPDWFGGDLEGALVDLDLGGAEPGRLSVCSRSPSPLWGRGVGERGGVCAGAMQSIPLTPDPTGGLTPSARRRRGLSE